MFIAIIFDGQDSVLTVSFSTCNPILEKGTSINFGNTLPMHYIHLFILKKLEIRYFGDAWFQTRTLLSIWEHLHRNKEAEN